MAVHKKPIKAIATMYDREWQYKLYTIFFFKSTQKKVKGCDIEPWSTIAKWFL